MEPVAPGTTAFFGLILLAMIISLALEEKLHAKKSIITGVAAVISLFFGGLFLHFPHPSGGHMPIYVPFIDWEVIFIILGSSLFVDVVSRSGIFSWIAIKMTKLSGGDPAKLLTYYGLLTVLFSAALNNVTAMIIIGSLTAVSLDKLNLKEKLLGFLIVEGLLTNVGGLLTLISSVPNIIVGQKAGISFLSFFLCAAPYVLLSTWVSLYMGKKLFQINPLKGEKVIEEAQTQIASFDENDGIQSFPFFYFSWVMFGLLIFLFATQSLLPVLKDLGLGFVAMSMAIIVLVRYKSEVNKNYESTDWDLIFFFAFLFVVIGVMEHAGVLAFLGEKIAELIKLGPLAGKMALLWGSAFASSVTDNIPLAAVLASILNKIYLANPDTFSPSLWWCVIFGANLGGNLTPIGSASTLVAVTIIHKNKIPLTFFGFVQKAFPLAIVQLSLSAGYVLLILPWLLK